MAGKTPAHPPQDPQTPRSMDLPGWLLSAEKNPPRGPQRGHSLVAAPHRRPTAPAHPPERLPTTQQLVKESCTVAVLCGLTALLAGELLDLGVVFAPVRPRDDPLRPARGAPEPQRHVGHVQV